MNMSEFLGYPRSVGKAGIRNTVLILPITRFANQVAWQISQLVTGVTVWQNPGELGRHQGDRERLRRVMIGLASNPNTYGIVICGVRADFGYPENKLNALLPILEATGKPIEIVMIENEGGVHQATARGVDMARELVFQASQVRTCPVPTSELTIGLKCGHSDATSGMAGNPVLGRAVDLLIGQGGTVIFSETTEVIGAEHILSDRATSSDVSKRFLEMVHHTEEQARAVGQDIRSINPIPSNIAAGITTLEEKSLGAVVKTGTTPLNGVVEYAGIPAGNGLWFMDGWMSSYSLPMSLAAAGAQLVIYQFGGQDLPEGAPMPAINTGVVSPLFFTTGNPNTAKNARHGVDYNASGVLLGTATLEQAGKELYERIVAVSSGDLVRGETLSFKDPLEIYFDGPVF
jgi:altronate dehydratase large subunit